RCGMPSTWRTAPRSCASAAVSSSVPSPTSRKGSDRAGRACDERPARTVRAAHEGKLMRRRTGRLIAAMLTAGLVLGACGDSGDDDKAGEKPAPVGFANGFVVEPDDSGTPVQGGQLQVVTYSEARVLDPVQTIANGSSGGTEMAAVFDLLMRYDPVADEYVPQLAEGLTANDAQ